MEQYLNPLVASIIGKEGGLPVDECIALTAAAMVIQGPLALAPALVAVQRHRDTDSPDGSDSGGSGEVGPPLVKVPDLIGQSIDDERGRLKDLGLVPKVSRNQSADDEKDMVLDQPPPPLVGGRVDAGTEIKLKVGAGQPKVDETPGDDAVAIAELRRDVDERLGKVDEQLGKLGQAIQKLTEMVAKAAALVASPAAQAGEKKPPGS